MARTWVRLYTSQTTYTDYDDVWGLSIDPISLTGAEMFIEEGRKAQFSLYLDEDWISGGLTNNWGEAPSGLRFIRRVWVEIWDTPLDSDTSLVIFAGFLFRDSIKFDVTLRTLVGSNYVQQLKQGTVTVYDWMSTFIKIHENSVLQLEEGQYVIRDQLQALFNEYSVDWSWPLNLCGVGFQLNIYPDFGTVFNNEPIWTSSGRYDNIYARLYQSAGVVKFELFSHNTESISYLDYSTTPPTTYYNHGLHSRHNIYTVYGTSVVIDVSFNNDDAITGTTDPRYPAEWSLQDQLDYFGLDISGWSDQNTTTLEQATYTVSPQTTTQKLKLLASGTLTRTQIDITADAEVRLLEWVNYLLNTQYASLIQLGNTPSS